jgi:uncharacterized protein YndB with AHSA1/START domain
LRALIKIQFDVDVAAPIEDVFDYLSDPAKLHEWQGTTDVRVLTEGPVAVGTRIRETREVLGRKLTQTVEVTEHDPPRRFSLRVVEGPVKVTGSQELEERDGGTRIHVRAEGEAPRLAGAVMKPTLERQLRGHYDRLKRNLERV